MYLLTVSDDTLLMEGKVLIAQYRNDFPIHKHFGEANTRVFRVPSQTNYQVGRCVAIDNLRALSNEHEMLDYEESYLILCVVYEVARTNCNEIKALCVERINFPRTELIVNYDERLNMLNRLYPDLLVVKVEDGLQNVQPGDYINLHDSVLGGQWTLMLAESANTPAEFSRYLSNVEKTNEDALPIRPSKIDVDDVESAESVNRREEKKETKLAENDLTFF